MASNYCDGCENGENSSDDSDEENYTNNIDLIIGDIHNNESCYMCNGFYGPCFDDPVCATCHAFLFPNYALNLDHAQVYTEKSDDDGDSGNDEPADVFYPTDKILCPDDKGEDLIDRPNSPPDNLARRLEMISIAALPTSKDNSNIHIESLPPEILLSIFHYLDELSIWSVANVCRRWRQLIKYEIPYEKWEDLTNRRFPLYNPVIPVDDWFEIYSSLMNNSSCSMCLRQMAVRMQPPGEENTWRRNRLRSELKIMRSDPPDGIQAIPLDPPTCCHWQATISGPSGSPYEGGLFFLYLQVPYGYPMCPPVVRFITKIFHPNISRHGDIGIDSIQHNWSLALTISKVLISVQSLLTDPFCEVCMEPEVGQLYTNNRAAFEEKARQYTWRYAMADFAPSL